MCMFSREVDSVSDTCIFARAASPTTQFLAYQMKYQSQEPVAMVLPIPIRPGTQEDGVRFISLEKCPGLFDMMRAGFPPAATKGRSGGLLLSAPTDSKLKVHQVGGYEASFVPTLRDFARLDPRFQLPAATWKQLPGYAKFGFAVFKLKEGTRKVHPMAFEFPSSMPQRLFFPTVHVHDGKVHRRAEFHHELYCQMRNEQFGPRSWRESPQPAGMFMELEHAAKMVDPDSHLLQRKLRGVLANRDQIIG